jgi:hypothetical protein
MNATGLTPKQHARQRIEAALAAAELGVTR